MKAPKAVPKPIALRVNVTPDDHTRLVRAARKSDVSVAHIVRQAIRAYVS